MRKLLNAVLNMNTYFINTFQIELPATAIVTVVSVHFVDRAIRH